MWGGPGEPTCPTSRGLTSAAVRAQEAQEAVAGPRDAVAVAIAVARAVIHRFCGKKEEEGCKQKLLYPSEGPGIQPRVNQDPHTRARRAQSLKGINKVKNYRLYLLLPRYISTDTKRHVWGNVCLNPSLINQVCIYKCNRNFSV